MSLYIARIDISCEKLQLLGSCYLTSFTVHIEVHACVLYVPLYSCAVLDEATSALSEDTEYYLYTTLHHLGVTVMSVGHRSTLKKVRCYCHCLIEEAYISWLCSLIVQYHDQILTLRGDQSWQLTTNTNVALT